MMKYYQKPKRTFEKSGLVIPEQSFHVYLDNVTNTIFDEALGSR